MTVEQQKYDESVLGFIPRTRRERKAYFAHLPKPSFRGMLHLITAPLALLNGILLIIFTDGVSAKVAVAIFAVTAVVLFGHSSLYHRRNWSLKLSDIMRRIDHVNIFFLIAGTYTPLVVMHFRDSAKPIVLGIVWGGAFLGAALQLLWPNSPRWLQVPIYVGLGWTAVGFIDDFKLAGPVIVWLVVAGGIAYTIGAVFYAFRWPNPWPKTFGFHEFFHTGTVIGFACHAVAIWLSVLT